MPSITFRFKSSRYVGTVDIEGSITTCREVQEAIATKVSAPSEELRIYLAGSTEYLHPEEDLPAYAVVDVVRQVSSGRPAPRSRQNAGAAPASFGAASSANTDSLKQMTEEERLAQLQAEVTLDTGIDEVSGRFRRGRGGYPDGQQRANLSEMFAPPPKGYICHNCGKGGHLIQHCPASKGGKSMKVLSLPVGIPESMLVECTMDDPAAKFITRDGRVVKRRLDNSVFTGVLTASIANNDVGGGQPCQYSDKEKVEGTSAPLSTSEGSVKVEEEKYLCIVDKVLAKEAMKTPCCGKLLCSSCFTAMVEDAMGADILNADTGPPPCPGCGETLFMDDVQPAEEEQQAIELARKRRRLD